ncbi:hypothetical protein AA0113_g4790 [Alternaria arborescens]|uniref:Uncharacterized protein n=1 Tax=Alternaria arborescens TaxID=156630 RepID=A0A4V1X6N4_9PLEO|nr:hypothetical protein AA0112_g6766 [Alternaria arborescens]RYO67098.1 hypothetical protein AA0113_g4790 [Alternaria arborescens]
MSFNTQPHDSTIVWHKDALEKGNTYADKCAKRERDMRQAHEAHEAASILYHDSSNSPPTPQQQQPTATTSQRQTTQSNHQGVQGTSSGCS